jgi:hypothetical protein
MAEANANKQMLPAHHLLSIVSLRRLLCRFYHHRSVCHLIQARDMLTESKRLIRKPSWCCVRFIPVRRVGKSALFFWFAHACCNTKVSIQTSEIRPGKKWFGCFLSADDTNITCPISRVRLLGSRGCCIFSWWNFDQGLEKDNNESQYSRGSTLRKFSIDERVAYELWYR